MATQTARMSIEEYLRTSYSPDVDFVDGCIVERNLGEYPHSLCKGLLAARLLQDEDRTSVRGLISYRIRVSPSRVRVGDVVVTRASTPREPVAVTPPLLCIEALASQDTLSGTEAVLNDYVRMGVQNIWLVDPESQTAYTFDNMGLHKTTGSLAVPHTGITLDLEHLWNELD